MAIKSLYELINQIDGKFYFSYDKLPRLPEQPIFFYHVPKTGGISLFYALRGSALSIAKTVPQMEVPTIIKWDNVSELEQLQGVNINHNTMVVSHLPFGAHEMLGEHDFKLATVLREPVSRIVSQYTYQCMRSKIPPSHEGLQSFFRDEANINSMSKQLAADAFMDFSDALAGEKVFENLQAKFDIYGDIQYINSIITYYLSGFKLSNAIMAPMNATASEFKIDARAYTDEIKTLNKADCQLHELVLKHPRLPKSKPKNANMISPLTTMLLEGNEGANSIGGALTRGTVDVYKAMLKVDHVKKDEKIRPEHIAAAFSTD